MWSKWVNKWLYKLLKARTIQIVESRRILEFHASWQSHLCDFSFPSKIKQMVCNLLWSIQQCCSYSLSNMMIYHNKKYLTKRIFNIIIFSIRNNFIVFIFVILKSKCIFLKYYNKLNKSMIIFIIFDYFE